MKQSLILIFVSVFFLSCKNKTSNNSAVAAPVFKKEAEAYLIKATGDTIIKLDLEIADDDYTRETGLMYRDSMQDKQGMLFVFPEEELRSFYMKNTRMSLDLLFLDENYMIVSFQKNAHPLDEASLPSKVPAKYVLEINGGLADKLLLDINDRLVLEK